MVSFDKLKFLILIKSNHFSFAYCFLWPMQEILSARHICFLIKAFMPIYLKFFLCMMLDRRTPHTFVERNIAYYSSEWNHYVLYFTQRQQVLFFQIWQHGYLFSYLFSVFLDLKSRLESESDHKLYDSVFTAVTLENLTTLEKEIYMW